MENRLSVKIKLGYAAASVPDAGTYILVNMYFLFFLTTVVGIDPAVAGGIAAFGIVVNALLCPIMGYISDNTNSRYGRRIPFIFFSAVPMSLALFLMYSNFGIGGVAEILFYLLMAGIFWGSYSAFFIPYLAMGAELTSDYDERTVLRSYAYVFNMIGATLGAALTPIFVEAIIKAGGSVSLGWQLAAVLIGGSGVILIFVTCLATKGKGIIPAKETTKKALALGRAVIDMVREYADIIKPRSVKILIAVSIIYLAANTIHLSGRMYFYTYNLGMSGSQITLFLLFVTVCGLVLAPVILAFSEKYDKRKVLIFCMLISSLSIAGMRFIGVDGILELGIFSFMFSIGSSSYWQLIAALYYDLCELDELLNGKRREGLIVSLGPLAQALSSALSVQIYGLILKFAGFNGALAIQSEKTLFWLFNSVSIIPAILMILVAFLAYKYPIGKKKFGEILSQLDIRKKGGTPDLSKLKGVY